jgi:hypothetical protein
MFTIHNILEEKDIFSGNESETIEFVKVIKLENEDSDFSILGISDTIEYIDTYCDNLTIIKPLN